VTTADLSTSDPTASGNTLSFIDSISQDSKGKITATKKSVTVSTAVTSADANPVSGGAVHTYAEAMSNKVTSWSSTTTDTHYPSEKLVKDSLDNKVDKVAGKGLSTNDYTDAEKTKLAGIASGAEVNVIESVKVNGTALTVSDKAVDIPAAAGDVGTTNAYGVVTLGVVSLT